MRVALITQVPPVVEAYVELLGALGHEPVGVLAVFQEGGPFSTGEHVAAAARAGLDVVVPSTRARLAPLLRALDADVAICSGFPWVIPAEALEAPRLGVVNWHPAALPRYRGPFPIAWAIRNGETEVGITFHRMDATLDTGPILAQTTIPLDDEYGWQELTPKLRGVLPELLPIVLARVEAGEPGDPQDESLASYYSAFEPEYAEIDWSRPREEVARQIRAWSFGGAFGPGPFGVIDGQQVRVTRASLEPSGGRPVECGDGTLWVETEPAG